MCLNKSSGKWNGPLLSCNLPLYQKESLHKTTDHEETCVFHLHVHFQANQTHFHMKGFTQSLVLKQRWKATQKWPIETNLLDPKCPIWSIPASKKVQQKSPAVQSIVPKICPFITAKMYKELCHLHIVYISKKDMYNNCLT